MVRRNFRVYTRSQLLRQLHHPHRALGADMLNVHLGPCVQGDHAVAGHQRILRQCWRAIDPQLVRDSPMIDSIIDNKRRIFLMEA